MKLDIERQPCPKCGCDDWVIVTYPWWQPESMFGNEPCEYMCCSCSRRFGASSGKVLGPGEREEFQNVKISVIIES